MCSGDRDNTLRDEGDEGWGTIRTIWAIAQPPGWNWSPYIADFLFPPQRLPPGHPNKNSDNRKIASAWGTMGRGNRALYGRSSLPLFPLLIVPLANSFFPLSRLPTKNTKGSLSNNDGDGYKNVTFKKSEFAQPQTYSISFPTSNVGKF